jgi:hypothetical protein
MYFTKRRKQLGRALFWLEMAEQANNTVNAMSSINTPHPFWTPDEIDGQINRYATILAYCLLKYQIAIEKAK